MRGRTFGRTPSEHYSPHSHRFCNSLLVTLDSVPHNVSSRKNGGNFDAINDLSLPGPQRRGLRGRYSEHSRPSHVRLPSYTSHEFKERQWSHFSKLLREKWECQMEGHDVCVPTEDGQHFQLAEHNIEQWIRALVSNPYSSIFQPRHT